MTSSVPCHEDHLPFQVSSLSTWERVVYRSSAGSVTEGTAKAITARTAAPTIYGVRTRQPNRAANRGTKRASRGGAKSATTPARDRGRPREIRGQDAPAQPGSQSGRQQGQQGRGDERYQSRP